MLKVEALETAYGVSQVLFGVSLDIAQGEVVVVNDPPYEFSGTVESLNDGLACLRAYEVGGPSPESGHVACLWLSTWNAPQQDVEALGERWRKLLDGLEAGGLQ